MNSSLSFRWYCFTEIADYAFAPGGPRGRGNDAPEVVSMAAAAEGDNETTRADGDTGSERSSSPCGNNNALLRIDLSNNVLYALKETNLRCVPHLRYADFSANQLTTLLIATFRYNPLLEELRLHDNLLRYFGKGNAVSGGLHTMPKLRCLRLDSNRLRIATFIDSAGASGTDDLRINLNHNYKRNDNDDDDDVVDNGDSINNTRSDESDTAGLFRCNCETSWVYERFTTLDPTTGQHKIISRLMNNEFCEYSIKAITENQCPNLKINCKLYQFEFKLIPPCPSHINGQFKYVRWKGSEV